MGRGRRGRVIEEAEDTLADLTGAGSGDNGGIDDTITEVVDDLTDGDPGEAVDEVQEAFADLDPSDLDGETGITEFVRGELEALGVLEEEEEEEETTDEDTEDKEETSLVDIQATADAEQFDQTFLAKKRAFQIGGEINSPAPFPLQAIPRLAYTLNYNLVYDDERDRWVPQKKSSAGRLTLVASGTLTVAAGSDGGADLGISGAGRTLIPAAGVTNFGDQTDDLTFRWGGVQGAEYIKFELRYEEFADKWRLVVLNEEDDSIDLQYRVIEVTE